MNDKEKEDVRTKIRSEIEKTSAAIIEYKEAAKPISPENAIGRVSRMDAINNKSVIEAAFRKSVDKLNKLRLVEDSLDDNNFGLCLRCKSKIPIQRILLMPQSRNCVRCAH
tara:strand:+ start:767 stop:1099 length:333 start_codon:yes stop_codon:yes gene_type:complete